MAEPENFEVLETKYYVTRNDGTYMSLVPADKIPDGIFVKGYPRTLKDYQLRGKINLGSSYTLRPKLGEVVGNSADMKKQDSALDPTIDSLRSPKTRVSAQSIDGIFDNPASDAQEGRFSKRGDKFGHRRGRRRRANSLSKKDTPKAAKGFDIFEEISESAEPIEKRVLKLETPGQAPKQLVIKEDNVKPEQVTDKTICHYWIRTGTCDFRPKPQGCKYKHFMPRTLEGLYEIGKLDWPSWWKKHNLGYCDYCWSWVRTGVCDWTQNNPDIPCRHWHEMPTYDIEFHRGRLHKVPRWYENVDPNYKMKVWLGDPKTRFPINEGRSSK